MSKIEAIRVTKDQKVTEELASLNLKKKLLIDWFSGLVGGFVSVTCCAPLDVARTRHMVLATTKSHGVIEYKGFIHTLSEIYKQEGFRGLYKGYNVTAFTIPLFHSLYFSIFYYVKSYLNEAWKPDQHIILKNLGSSIFTGFVCDTLTNPLWVIRTRIQAQYLHRDHVIKYRGIFSGLHRIYHEEGIKAWYKGLVASYVGLSHAAILYPLYEELKHLIKEHKGSISNSDIFLASIASKFTAMVLTYPHVVIRARLQDNRTNLRDTNERMTFMRMLKTTFENEGVRGLYSGLRIDLVRCLPANAITFLTFEFVKKHLELLYSDEKKTVL